jgi:hypothetical protein
MVLQEELQVMKKILIATVGGSCAPVINAVRMGDYDYVFFVCSAGSKGSEMAVDADGKPCREDRDGKKDKSIVAQTGLSRDQYSKLPLDNPDDLGLCYQLLKELRTTINQRFGHETQVVANYTGGTKTMSVALGMAAMAAGWSLYLNLGPRTDLEKVRSADRPVPVTGVADVYGDQYEVMILQAAQRYDYSMVVALADDLLSMQRTAESQQLWLSVRTAAKGFLAWDAFDHVTALNLLSSLGRYYGKHLAALKKLTGQGKCNGYELVSDLLNNAERRALQERFDDAVARLYRATEMVAQIRLSREYGLDSNKLTLNDLPENLRSEYEPFVRDNGKVLLGLRKSFELLDSLGDPVGKLFLDKGNAVIGALTTRNNSIFGHGTEPVGREGYEKVKLTLHGFISEAVNLAKGRLDVPQFPCDLPMLAKT